MKDSISLLLCVWVGGLAGGWVRAGVSGFGYGPSQKKNSLFFREKSVRNKNDPRVALVILSY